jgi:spore coat protein U-like protein
MLSLKSKVSYLVEQMYRAVKGKAYLQQQYQKGEIMKKMQLIVMAAALLLMAGTAMAASGTATLNVSAAVKGTCSMTGGTLTFPLLDPSTAPAVSATSTGTSITCSNGTPYTVAASSANGGLLKNAANTASFAYTYSLPANGTGTGAAVAYDVLGNIAAGVYSAAPADVYNDTVTLTFSF